MSELKFERDYCAGLLRSSGSNFAMSFALLPRARREALMSVYAICRIVDEIADKEGEVAIAEAKLAWWSQEVHRALAADGEGEPPQHPVALCLRADARRFTLDEDYLQAIIAGVRSDLGGQSFADRHSLLEYCYRVASCVGLLSIAIFGFERDEVRDYAIKLGYAMQLTNIIRDVLPDARQGRVYLPADELHAAGIDPAALASQKHTSAELRAYLEKLGEEVEEMYAEAYHTLPASERRRQLPGLAMAETYRQLLAEMRRDGFRVMEYRLALPPHRKGWRLLATAARVCTGASLPRSLG